MATINQNYDDTMSSEGSWNLEKGSELIEEMKAPIREEPFRLMHLPREILRKVLFYSDLVVSADLTHGVHGIEIHYSHMNKQSQMKRRHARFLGVVHFA